MDLDLNALRKRVREVGVAKVARLARVPATTLYSFCQNPERELAFGTAVAVGQVLENFRASDLREVHVEAGVVPKSVQGIPVILQTASHKIFYHPVALAATMNLRWFDEAWLISLGRKPLHHYSMINVTQDGLSPLLQPGDQALIHTPAKPMARMRSGIFLIVTDDRLRFVKCERAEGRKSDVRYICRETLGRGASLVDVSLSQLVGEVVWIGRTLATKAEMAGAISSSPSSLKRTSKHHVDRRRQFARSRTIKTR